jgi:hypothetical protein
MSFSFAVFSFLLITAILVALPFVPGIRELRNKKDAKPLKVVSDSEVDIRHFARGFSQFVQSKLGKALEECARTGGSRDGVLDDGTPYLIGAAGGSFGLTEAEARDRATRRMILSCGDLKLPPETMFLPEIYAAGSVYGGERAIYRALLAEKNVMLGPESLSLRWIHAGGAVRVAKGAVLHGRVSADQAILLEGTCSFERLSAPRIEFGPNPAADGDTAAAETGSRQRTPMKPDEPARLADDSAGRWLYERDIELPAGKTATADIVGTRRVRVGKGMRIEGSIKGRKDMRLEDGVEVTGSVICGRNLFIGRDCRIHGPVIAEGNVSIGSGTIIGRSGFVTTVSAVGVSVASGTVVFGSVWAHTEGRFAGGGILRRDASFGRAGV